MRAAGATQEQVARALDCSVETIRRTERWAEENGILEGAHNKFVKMLDQSARVYNARLNDDANNPKLALDAARDIAFGTGVLRKQHGPSQSAAVEEESLTLILKRRRQRLAESPGSSSGSPNRGDAIDGEVVTSEAPAQGGEVTVQRVVGAAADGEELFTDAE